MKGVLFTTTVYVFCVWLTGSVLLSSGCTSLPRISADLRHPSKPKPISLEAALASTNLSYRLGCLRVGWSEKQVAAVVEPFMIQCPTNMYLFKYPFCDLLPSLRPECVTEYRTQEKGASGWPELVFLVFADPSKTKLVDAFWYHDGVDIRPLVEGNFEQAFASVKKGDSMLDVYAKLGKRSAKYYMGEDGRWYVRFSYVGYGGRFYYIVAEAGTGRVVRKGDATI